MRADSPSGFGDWSRQVKQTLAAEEKRIQNLNRIVRINRRLSAQGKTQLSTYNLLSDKERELYDAATEFAAFRETSIRDRKRVARQRLASRRKFRADRNAALRENLMLGAGFPLLFGGGVGAVAGGVGGAWMQSSMGKKGGFGAQILLSALGQQIDAFVVKTKELGDVLRKPTENLQALRDAAGIAGTDIDRTSKRLEQLGLKASAAALVQAEISDFANIKGLQAMSEAWQDLSNIFAKLTLQTMSFISGPLTAAIRKMEEILGHQVDAGVLRKAYEPLDAKGKALFNQRLRELMPERTKNRGLFETLFPTTPYEKIVQGKIPPSVLKELQAQFDPASAPGLQKDLNAKVLRVSGQDVKDLRAKVELEKERLDIPARQFEIKTKEIDINRQQLEINWQLAEWKKMEDGLEKDILQTKIEKLVAQKELSEAELANVKRLTEADAMYRQIGATIRDGMVNAIESAIEGTKTLGDVAASVFRSIARMLLQYGVTSGLKGLFPGSKFTQGLAEGGTAHSGRPYVVGEKGPELFVPGRTGTVVPNHAMGGVSNVTINVDAGGTSMQGDAGQAQALGRMLANAVQEELVRQKRPGGLLTH